MSAVVNSMYITPRDYPFALPVSCQKLRMFGNHLYHRGNGMFMLLQGYEFDGCSVKIRLFDTIDIGISDGPLTAEGVPEMFWPSAVHDIGYEFVIELAEHFGLNVWQMRKIIDDAFLEHGRKWTLPGSDREDHYYAAVRKLGWICVLRRYARAIGWVKALKSLALDRASVEAL